MAETAVTHRRSAPLYDGRRTTPAQFLDLPEDGYRYELIDGVLLLSPTPIDDHNRPHSEFLTELKLFLRKHPELGELFFEMSVFLPDGNVLEPDISFVAADRLDIVTGHLHGAPDLVVEVLSPSTRRRDLGVKAESYLGCGVREYWIVDPADRSLQVWNAEGEGDSRAWNKRRGDRLESVVLQGFAIEAKTVFRT